MSSFTTIGPVNLLLIVRFAVFFSSSKWPSWFSSLTADLSAEIKSSNNENGSVVVVAVVVFVAAVVVDVVAVVAIETGNIVVDVIVLFDVASVAVTLSVIFFELSSAEKHPAINNTSTIICTTQLHRNHT